MSRPNILFLLSDQMQKQVLDPGHPCQMPNTRRLMEQSVVFNNAHTCNAICSPSRASLLTGMLPHNHGMVDCTHTVPDYRANYDSSLDTMTRALRDEGYALGYYGKWHIERTHRLEDYGFIEYQTERELPKFSTTPVDKLTVSNKGYSDRVVCGIFSEGEEHTEEHYIYNCGIDFIERHHKDNRPWCAFLSTYAPHDPYTVPKEIYDLYGLAELPESFSDCMDDKPAIYRRMREVWSGVAEDDLRKIVTCYHSYCTLLDRQIGRLITYLEKSGFLDNTMIVFLSDHGDMMGAHGLFCKGVPAFEEVYNIPLFIKLPGGIHAGQRNVLVNTQDIAPTVLELANCRQLRGKLDGSSFAKWIYDSAFNEQRLGFAEFQGQRYAYTQRIVWSGNYKYVFNTFDYDELYDLAKDPGEMVNLAKSPQHRNDLEHMARLMWSEMKRTGDETMYDAEYFVLRFAPVGPEEKCTGTSYSTYNKAF